MTRSGRLCLDGRIVLSTNRTRLASTEFVGGLWESSAVHWRAWVTLKHVMPSRARDAAGHRIRLSFRQEARRLISRMCRAYSTGSSRNLIE
jgi:hypothetical protein